MEENQPSFKGHIAPISMKSKCRMLPRMARFIVPLGSVYLFEYFINQGVVIEDIFSYNNNFNIFFLNHNPNSLN
jgi:hypothetical protein